MRRVTLRKLLLIAGVAALTLPGLAHADTVCHHEKNNNRVVGTVVGAVGGGLIGNAITHGHGPGTVLGAIAGGVAGNVIGGSSVHCDRYDNGYYDRDGDWHYSSYRTSGYYDEDGRWIAYSAPRGGYYDAYGRWVPNGSPSAGYYGRDSSYYGGGNFDYRLNRAEDRIRNDEASGRISGYAANRAFTDINRLRGREERLENEHGGLTAGDVDDLTARLNGVIARAEGEY